MTRMTVTEQELKEYAQEQSKTIVIRSYDRGNSSDDERHATAEESKIIESIIFGALLAIRNGSDIQDVKHTAEYIGIVMLPNANTYDTIYNRIGDYAREHKAV